MAVPLVFVAYYAFTDESFRFTTENLTKFFTAGMVANRNLNQEGMIPVSYTHLDVYKRQFYIRLKTFSHETLPDGTGILEGYIQNITDIQQRRNDITLLTHAINNLSLIHI